MFLSIRFITSMSLLFSIRLHPLYQLAPLLSSLSYPLQKHQDYEELQSLTTQTDIAYAILTLIYFITMERVDSSLLTSLVVSSSSTTTTSSPRLWRI